MWWAEEGSFSAGRGVSWSMRSSQRRFARIRSRSSKLTGRSSRRACRSPFNTMTASWGVLGYWGDGRCHLIQQAHSVYLQICRAVAVFHTFHNDLLRRPRTGLWTPDNANANAGPRGLEPLKKLSPYIPHGCCVPVLQQKLIRSLAEKNSPLRPRRCMISRRRSPRFNPEQFAGSSGASRRLKVQEGKPWVSRKQSQSC